MTAFSLAMPSGIAAGIAATAGERTISLFHIHTEERLTILYKKDGKYIPEALEKINWIMRDWRKNETIKIDPETIDIIWEMHEELGSQEPVNIICGYRSRGTNEMLRRTVGGQASQSQHITGKAIDISFPDIPLHQMRYSALIRERGGVGYYPTSGIPFIHVDTSRVRHWPRMPRDELALLFKDGHSKHVPSDGRPITPYDVAAARERQKDLAQKVAAFYDLRSAPKTATLVADATPVTPAPPALVPPQPKLATRPAQAPELKMSVGAPMPPPAAMQVAAAPKLMSEPHLVERPSHFTTLPSGADKKKLDQLVRLAAFEPPAPKLVAAPAPVQRPAAPAATKPSLPKPIVASLGALPAAPEPASRPAAPNDEITAKLAALDANPADTAGDSNTETDKPAGRFDFGANWSAAPDYDEDHPEELSYRPFPLGPFLTASPDDPALAKLVHPDVARTLDLIDDDGEIQPMKLRPGRQVAQLMWAHEFRGEAVGFGEPVAIEPPKPAPNRIAERAVKTVAR